LALCDILSLYFSEGTKETPKNFIRYSQYILSNSNRTLSKHVSEILPSDSARSSWSVYIHAAIQIMFWIWRPSSSC